MTELLATAAAPPAQVPTFTDQFLKDVATHQLEVIRDDGIYRHLRFKRTDTMCMHFDLLTWPGYLCYTGDMGTFVFSRLRDMFEFFRRSNAEQPYRMDKRYWAEKVEASDKSDGVTEFSEQKFDRVVMERLVSWIRNNARSTTPEERRELWEAVVDEVINAEPYSGGHRKQVAAYDFYHRVNPSVDFSFEDFWESNVNEYTHRFQWCCHALVWGIGVYDAAKETSP